VRSSYDEQFEQEAGELQRQAQTSLRDLGRIDSQEKVERARQIRARLEDHINRLKHERAQQLREGVAQRFDLGTGARPDQARDALTDRARNSLRTDLQDRRDVAGEIRDRTADALRQNQTRQVVRQNADPADVQSRPAAGTPTATPEPKAVEERPVPDSTTSDSNANGESQDENSGGRP
jgi:hypothetical protein